MSKTPNSLGFHFPAEWYEHEATWLSWPHNTDSWPGKIDTIFPPYCAFIKAVSEGEMVCINVVDHAMEEFAKEQLKKAGVDLSQIRFYPHATNDAWCRDHGPAFVINKESKTKAVVNWGYNAWGEKYPPYDLDNQIPKKVSERLGLDVFTPGIVMEGGAVDFNGEGVVLTTTSCLLNKNRNPHLSQQQIEGYLKDYYGVHTVWWLGDGIVGDDTDGHIDDITRFVNRDTVVTAVEKDPEDENYEPLQSNLELLKSLTLPDGSPLKVIELPMPKAIHFNGQRLPASYANFYIANSCVVVPTYRDQDRDQEVLDLLTPLFPDREVIGIDSADIVWGLGSFHCLSQQEPAV